MARVLVAFDTIEGQTRKIADYIGNRVVRGGHEVRVMDVAELSQGTVPEGFDGAVIGASIHVGRHSKRFVDFVTHRRLWLEGLPVAFFSVSLSAGGDAQEQQEAQGYLDNLLNQTGWKPQAATTIAGGLRYRKYGIWKRIMMKKISQKAGRETDTSRDHDYTDWTAVDRFTDAFLSWFPAESQS